MVSDDNKIKVRFRTLKITKGNIDYYYRLDTLEWNWWLNRFYPKAELIQEVIHHNRQYN